MKLNKTYTLSVLNHLVAIVMLAIICIQPVIQSIALLTNSEFEIVQIDTEEDGEEKEQQKDYSKKYKKQLATPISYHPTYLDKKLNSYTLLALRINFDQEIPIPPPDKV